MLADPKIPLWITEGQKKADALASLCPPGNAEAPAGSVLASGPVLAAISLLGVWNFKGKNELGGVTWLADWDLVALKGRPVRLVFDSDVLSKRPVQQALQRLTEHLERKGAQVRSVYLPPGPHGEKLGVDDWLALGHTFQELEALAQAPPPLARPALAVVELLDAPPPTLSRPLGLINFFDAATGGTQAAVDGFDAGGQTDVARSYAAAWHYARVTRKEGLDKRGELVRYNPPQVTIEQKLFIMRRDGLIFGDGGDRPLEELNLQVRLPEIPPSEKTWSAAGFRAYHEGRRPHPKDVFERLVKVIDRFIDFDRSLGGQEVMAELVACYILSTWFLEAFNVIGFLWPNGDRGCGKTHLLMVVCELAYLGQVILAGGSFASIRDLADYGATLAFDDAEKVADARHDDADKRALLLAGNRRGVLVPLKELGPDKRWFNRYVNAFCPRLFSAIRLPDPVLSSRTIVIPLICTADPRRANADPLDFNDWPCNRRQLIDDLWALALAHLPEFPAIDRWVGQNASLTGRNLQPWRAILSVANWLETYSVQHIWTRMTQLSLDYQKERPELETPNLTVLTLRALLDCVKKAPSRTTDYTFYTAEITAAVIELARTEEANLDVDAINTRRIGLLFRKLRFRKDRQPGSGARRWVVSLVELRRLAISYGLVNT